MGILQRLIDEWFDERAMRKSLDAYNEYQNDIMGRRMEAQNLQDMISQGSAPLPGIHSLTGGANRGVLPVNKSAPGMQAEIMRTSTLPPIPPDLLKTDLGSRLAFQLANDFFSENPHLLAEEQRREMEKVAFNTRAGVVGNRGEQNLIGTDELDPLLFGSTELPRGEALNRLGEREAAATTARQIAQEPFRDRALQRKIKLKQTPGARAIGSGDDVGGVVSSVTSTDLNRIEKMLLTKGDYFYIDDSDPVNKVKRLNRRGQAALEIAADRLSRMKKKNPLKVVKESMDEERRMYELSLTPDQRTLYDEKSALFEQGINRLGAGRKVKEPEAGAKIPTYPKGVPELLRALPAEPPAQVKANALPAVQDPATVEKINLAISVGATPDEIRRELINERKNPADYGY